MNAINTAPPREDDSAIVVSDVDAGLPVGALFARDCHAVSVVIAETVFVAVPVAAAIVVSRKFVGNTLSIEELVECAAVRIEVSSATQ